MWNDFLSLIYPRICPGCSLGLMKNEKCICTDCLTEIHKTDYYKYHSNPVSKILWGRIVFESAMSLYSYNKDSRIQKLIHALKYNNQPEIGEVLGVELGKELIKKSETNDFDVIIPVPLHKLKKRKRGYNQSYHIAKGVSSVLKIPIHNELIVKTSNRTSQTTKNRYNRWENSRNTYILNLTEKIFDKKHALIVDDVITTGSTIESCVQALNHIEGLKVSIATLAMS